MAGRKATPADYHALDTLYATALAAAKTTWGGKMYDSPPDWGANPVYVSTDAQGIRVGIATHAIDSDFSAPSMNGLVVPLGEENWLLIGPRSGLQSSVMITATLECLRAWLNDIRARGKPDTYIAFGTIPTAWNANFKAIWVQRIGCSVIDLKAGEWPLGPQGAKMTVLYDTIANWDAKLKAAGA